MNCQHCTHGTVPGNGWNYGAHQCPDCEGEGEIEYCPGCDELIPASNELCHSCEEKRDEENEE